MSAVAIESAPVDDNLPLDDMTLSIPLTTMIEDDSTMLMIEEDDAGPPLTSRTHDGTIGHQTKEERSSTVDRPPSPSQSAYTPSTSTVNTAPVTTVVVGNTPPKKSATGSSEESKESDDSTTITLAKTQPLVARPPSRPSSTVSIRSSSSRRVASSTSASAASKLPFYQQALQPVTPSTTQPLTPQHMATLPLSAAVAHVSRANVEALELMKRKEYQIAFERLKRAEAFCSVHALKTDRTKSSISLRASTYNNLAILYKSVHQLRHALFYANRALRLEINFVPVVTQSDGMPGPRPNPAGTHLNMCAILSTMGRHGSALLHAECALSSLYLELHQLAAINQARKAAIAHARENGDSTGDAGAGVNSAVSHEGDKQSILHLIAIAYHNMAVEQEFLRQFRASTHSYRRAAEFASKRLGTEHLITRTIQHAYEGAVNLHPLKVTGPNQSMNPHTKLTVTNTAATASEQANKNKWLIPSLENNPMTARHIPVRFVPFNQFVSVAGLPGRDPKRRSSVTSSSVTPTPPTTINQTDNPTHTHHHKHHSHYDELYDENFLVEEEEDEDFGPAITESSLRARNQAQNQSLTSSSASPYPSHPPPSIPMNPEEPLNGAGGIGTDGTTTAVADGDEEAGYWSDPELTTELIENGNNNLSGSSHQPRSTKVKHDPRIDPHQLRPVRIGGRTIRAGSAAGGGKRIPTSASLGQLESNSNRRTTNVQQQQQQHQHHHHQSQLQHPLPPQHPTHYPPPPAPMSYQPHTYPSHPHQSHPYDSHPSSASYTYNSGASHYGYGFQPATPSPTYAPYGYAPFSPQPNYSSIMPTPPTHTNNNVGGYPTTTTSFLPQVYTTNQQQQHHHQQQQQQPFRPMTSPYQYPYATR